MNHSIIEATKEAGRLLLLAIVSYLLTEGVLDYILSYFLGVQIDTTTKVQVIAIITTLLRSIDKYLHETGKDSGSDSPFKGLTGF